MKMIHTGFLVVMLFICPSVFADKSNGKSLLDHGKSSGLSHHEVKNDNKQKDNHSNHSGDVKGSGGAKAPELDAGAGGLGIGLVLAAIALMRERKKVNA